MNDDILVKGGLTEVEQLQDDIDELQVELNKLNYKNNEKDCKEWANSTDRNKAYRIIAILKEKRMKVKQLKGII